MQTYKTKWPLECTVSQTYSHKKHLYITSSVTTFKVKFSLEQATKAQRVSRGIALPFHDLGA